MSSFASTPLDARRRHLVIAICCLSVLVVGTDSTIVNVGLASIQRGLGASVSGLQWVVAAYTLVLASLLMLSGSLADRLGRRRVFQAGMTLFTLGSLLCSLAPSLGMLIAFRVIQAVGASALNPVALSIIAHAIDDRRERARAMGIWGSVAGLGLAVGPIVGGLLIAAVGWRSIFYFNVPLGVAAIVCTQLVVPESRASRPRRIDAGGQVLMIALIASLTGAIIEGQRVGWTSVVIVGLFAVALAAGLAFVAWERRVDEPMLELRFFASVPFTGATINALAAFGALGGYLFLNSLFLQDVRHESPLHAGLLTVPLAVMMALLAPLSGRLVAGRGPRIPFVIAGICGIVGPLLLVGLRSDTSIVLLLGSYVVFGSAMGMVNAPISNAAVSGMPPDQTGVAASVASTARQTGSALGVALTGAFVSGGTGATFARASHPGWMLLAGCGAVVLVCGLISTGRWARSTSARVNADRATSGAAQPTVHMVEHAARPAPTPRRTVARER